MITLATARIVLPLVVVVVAIASELRTKEIPNWLTFGAFLAAWPLAYFAGTLPLAAGGFFLAFGVILIGYQKGYVGGGALKLAGAIGALTSPTVALAIIVVAIAAAAASWRWAKHVLEKDLSAHPPVPPGSICVAIGTIMGLLLAARFG